MIEIVVPEWDKYRPAQTLAAINRVRALILAHKGTTRVQMIREAPELTPILAAKVEA